MKQTSEQVKGVSLISTDLVRRLRIEAGASHGDGAEESLEWRAANLIEELESALRVEREIVASLQFAKANAEARAKVALQKVLPALLQLPGDVQAVYSAEIEAVRAIAGAPNARTLTDLREEMRSKARGES